MDKPITPFTTGKGIGAGVGTVASVAFENLNLARSVTAMALAVATSDIVTLPVATPSIAWLALRAGAVPTVARLAHRDVVPAVVMSLSTSTTSSSSSRGVPGTAGM